MRRFVLHHQHKGLACVTSILEAVDREIGNNIGAVTLDTRFTFRRDQIWVVVQPLSRENFPVIKNLRRSFEVRFPVESRRVTRLLQ